MTSFRLFLFPPRTELQTLQLYPMYFAGMVCPIVSGDGGININAYEENETGIFCLIDPYTGMGVDDQIDIFWDHNIIHDFKVKLEEVNKPLFFFLPKDDIVPGLAEAYYQVTRFGEALPDEPSAKLMMFVKLSPPAGEDKEQHLPWHSELDIVGLPQDVITNGVTKEWSAKGVPMIIKQYPDMCVRDVIWVMWGTILLTPHEVTQDEADGSAEIVITALPGDILTAGDSSRLSIRYLIHDEVFNYSDKWSKETTVMVDAGSARLDAAIFEDAEDGELHLDELDHQATSLVIKIENSDLVEFTPGDTIEIKVVGIAGPGTAPRTFKKEVIVGNQPYILEQPIPYEFVSLFATGQLDGSYVLRKKDGSLPLYSKRTFVDVIGNPALLPAPTIHEVIGAILPANSKLATVEISYPSMATGDTLNMIWEGTKSDSTPYVHEEQHDVSNEDEVAEFTQIYVQAEHILALANGSLKLYYRVYNEETAKFGISESDYLRVEVRDIQATLPAPKVEEAKDGVIDPTQVDTQAHVLIEPVNWEKGDVLTYYWRGIYPSTSTRASLPITLLNIDKPVRFRVDERFVSGNIGDYVDVLYTLKHESTGRYSYSLTETVLIGFLLGDLPQPEVEQASAGSLDPMKALEGVDIKVKYESMDPLLDNIRLKWLGVPGSGSSEDQELPGHPNGFVTFHLAASFIGPNINKVVSVSYDVKRYGRDKSSETLSLPVLAFQDPEKQLPRPQVPQAIAAILDLMEFTGDAEVLVLKWPYIALEQRVWLVLEGPSIAGPDYSIKLLDGILVTATQVVNGLKEPLLRTELLKLAHASAATVRCKVAFDGENNELNAVLFPELQLTVRTRYDYITPTITSVSDDRGEVADGGKTGAPEVKIEGRATRGERVELFDNQTESMGLAPVGDNGIWQHTVADLVESRTYRISAKALYDAEPASSPPRTFTRVVYAETPVIRTISDSRGLVHQAGTTYDRSVTIEGDAADGKQIQLREGSTVIDTIDVDTHGTWKYIFSGLQVRDYRLKAIALYEADPVESELRDFTVKDHVAPRIDSVKGGGVEIPEGADTRSLTVSVSGIVTPDHDIQLYDNNVAKQIVTAVGQTWTTSLSVLVDRHSLHVIALSTQQKSNSRSFRVISPLTITPAQISLAGWIFRDQNTPSNPPAGSFIDCRGVGGQPPYRFSSTNSAIAEVNLSTGRVISKGNGQAVITVMDGLNQSASCPVSVSNVHILFGTGSFNTHTECAKRAASQGGRIPSLGEWRLYISTHATGRPNVWCWASDSGGFNRRWAIMPSTGQTQTLRDFGFGGDTANGFGIT